jgi:hypothetical protein
MLAPVPGPDFGRPRYPTTAFDPSRYIRKPVGARIITVRARQGEDLSPLVQATQDTPGNITVSIEGGGSFKSQVRIKHHTKFDSSEYFCDTTGAQENTGTNNSIWYGCFLIDDDVLVEGTWRPPTALNQFFEKPGFESLKKVQALTDEEMAGTGTVIWESSFHTTAKPGGDDQPSVTVFQAYQDAISQQHERESRNITIMGFHIKGRQTVSDGGTRQTIVFGNCVGGAAMVNYLDATASIGIQFGGSGHEGNHADDFLVWRNVTKQLPAANVAMVNGRKGIIAENYGFRLGKKGFGGGVSWFDLETNDVKDLADEIWIFDNLIDYEGSYQDGAGNAINLQDPGFNAPVNGNIFAVNNWIIGGRDDGLHRYMSSGIFVATLNKITLASNYVFKTGQNAVQWTGLPVKMTKAKWDSLEERFRESYKAFKVYIPDGEDWKLHPDRQATGKGSVIKDNWFDSTGGGGNATVRFDNVEGVDIGPNKFTVQKDVKFGTDSRIQVCGGKDNTAHDNLLNGKVVDITTEGCPKA